MTYNRLRILSHKTRDIGLLCLKSIHGKPKTVLQITWYISFCTCCPFETEQSATELPDRINNLANPLSMLFVFLCIYLCFRWFFDSTSDGLAKLSWFSKTNAEISWPDSKTAKFFARNFVCIRHFVYSFTFLNRILFFKLNSIFPSSISECVSSNQVWN